jgi:hypothetical protein
MKAAGGCAKIFSRRRARGPWPHDQRHSFVFPSMRNPFRLRSSPLQGRGGFEGRDKAVLHCDEENIMRTHSSLVKRLLIGLERDLSRRLGGPQGWRWVRLGAPVGSAARRPGSTRSTVPGRSMYGRNAHRSGRSSGIATDQCITMVRPAAEDAYHAPCQIQDADDVNKLASRRDFLSSARWSSRSELTRRMPRPEAAQIPSSFLTSLMNRQSVPVAMIWSGDDLITPISRRRSA